MEIAFTPERNVDAIRDLVTAFEGERAGAWNVETMGPRFDRLESHVIAFPARVTSASARFKLGQDEDRLSLQQILEWLGDSPLAHAMCEANGASGDS